MRLQTLLQQGPLDGEMIVVDDEEGEWPYEIRVGSADDASSHDEDKIEVWIYLMHEEPEEAIGRVWLGSYSYSGMKHVYPTLVHVWI